MKITYLDNPCISNYDYIEYKEKTRTIIIPICSEHCEGYEYLIEGSDAELEVIKELCNKARRIHENN